jgi:hypothetical protein
MTDTAKLRALAAEATDGPWFGPRITDAWPPGEWGVYAADDDGTPIPHAIIARMPRQVEFDDESNEERLDRQAADDESRNNAAFIAAANPTAVIALLDEVDAKQRGYDDLHQMVPGPGDIWSKIDAVLKRLVAVTAARDEACDIAARWFDDHPGADGERLDELRKVGAPCR